MLIIQAGLMQVRDGTGKQMRTPESIHCECRDMATCAQEMFVVITLDTRNGMIARHLVTLGLLSYVPVSPREIFRPAIADSAAAIVLVHNHPSGDATPSSEDLRITRQMIDAGRVLGVPVMDHVVIGRGDIPFLSLREKGLANFDWKTDERVVSMREAVASRANGAKEGGSRVVSIPATPK